MSFQVSTIVLYHRSGKVRMVPLRHGSLNIITGQSNRGKSAIIQILEYCLGRSSFMIPEGRIRESVAWYAVLLQFSDQQAFIAKPAPSAEAVSQSSVHLRLGKKIDVPALDSLVINSNDSALETWLSQKLGISPNLNIPDTNATRLPLEASVKHTLFYLFQDQSIIANKDLLFHRQSEQFLPQSIRDTLPYLLGAIREDQLKLVQELREARRALKIAQKHQHEEIAITGITLRRGHALVAEARQVGLTDAMAETQEGVLELLRSLQQWKPTILVSPDDKIAPLHGLINELQDQLRIKSDQIAASESFAKEAEGYSGEVNEQIWRLESIKVFEDLNVSTCPLCDSELHGIVPNIEELRSSLSALNKGFDTVARERPRLREYIETLKKERSELQQTLQQRRLELQTLSAERDQWEEWNNLNARIAHVLGRISLYLESVASSTVKTAVSSTVEVAEREVLRLEELLEASESEDRENSILSLLSRQMTEWASRLELEHRNYPYRLDLKQLTVVADRPERPIPMFRMGGGQNWLGCHLIALLALHRHFCMQGRPVPRILVLDQPSQVYFATPDVYRAISGTISDTNTAAIAANADMEAVRRMFRFLLDFCAELAPDFQILVLEHANLEEDWFQAALVEEPWAGNRGLIPEDWT